MNCLICNDKKSRKIVTHCYKYICFSHFEELNLNSYFIFICCQKCINILISNISINMDYGDDSFKNIFKNKYKLLKTNICNLYSYEYGNYDVYSVIDIYTDQQKKIEKSLQKIKKKFYSVIDDYIINDIKQICWSYMY